MKPGASVPPEWEAPALGWRSAQAPESVQESRGVWELSEALRP